MASVISNSKGVCRDGPAKGRVIFSDFHTVILSGEIQMATLCHGDKIIDHLMPEYRYIKVMFDHAQSDYYEWEYTA